MGPTSLTNVRLKQLLADLPETTRAYEDMANNCGFSLASVFETQMMLVLEVSKLRKQVRRLAKERNENGR